MTSYRVLIETFHAGSWDVAYGDDPDTCELLDPLTLEWSRGSGAEWPAQPEPMVLQWRVLVPEAADLPLSIGDIIYATITPVAGYEIAFMGRITAAGATPDLPPPYGTGGMVHDFTATDATAELADSIVDLLADGASSFATRLQALLAAARTTPPALTVLDTITDWTEDGGAWAQQVRCKPKTYDAGPTLRDALVEVCDWVAGRYYGDGQRLWRPIVSPLPYLRQENHPWNFLVEPLPEAWPLTAGDMVDRLTWDGARWQLTHPDHTVAAGFALDACEVDVDTSWTAERRVVANRGRCFYWTAPSSGGVYTQKVATRAGATPEPGMVAVTKRRESEIAGYDTVPASIVGADNNADTVANILTTALIPPGRGWFPDEMTWTVPEDADQFPPFFPQHGISMHATEQRTRCYVQPVTVNNIRAAWNRSGTGDQLRAPLAGAKLTISGGVVSVVFTLGPEAPSPRTGATTPGGMTWDQLATTTAAHPATWNNLDPTETWDDWKRLGAA